MNMAIYILAFALLLICFYWAFGIFISLFFSILYKKKWEQRGKKSYVPNSEELEHQSSKNNKFLTHIRNFVDGYIRTLLRDVSKIHSHAVRNFIYKFIYKMDVATKAVIYGGAEIRSPEKISIGKGTIIGDEAKLDGRNGIFIGKNVNLSTGVWIWTEQHDINSPQFSLSSKDDQSVVIEDRAWLGSRTTILPGVHIGEGAVICAGAVVTKDCEPFGVYAGIPAKKIKQRNNDLQYEFDGKHYMFY